MTKRARQSALGRAALALAAITAVATPADAKLIYYTVSGFYEASWTLDDAVEPTIAAGGALVFWNVDYVFNGVAGTQDFFTSADGDFMDITQFAFGYFGDRPNLNNFQPDFGAGSFDWGIPGLYTRSLDDDGNVIGRSFSTGTFDFAEGYTSQGFAPIRITASLAPPAGEAAVPEPASWALLLAGFGLVGSALRRRTRAAAAV